MQKSLKDFIDKNLRTFEMVIVCVGGGGGSGSGLSIPIIRQLLDSNMKVGVIYTLPESYCDVVVKKNALQVYQEIHSEYGLSGEVSPLILVDNELLRGKFRNISIDKAYPAMNRFIIGTLETFNLMSQKRSSLVSAIDKKDFLRLMGTGGCCTMGQIMIDDFKHKNSVAEGLNTDVFVNDFDMRTAKAGGIIIIASDKVFSKPASTEFINYIFQQFRMTLDNPPLIYRGVYDGRVDDKIEIRTFINGLSFPKARFEELFEETRRGVSNALRKNRRIGDELSYDFEGSESLDAGLYSPNTRRKRSDPERPKTSIEDSPTSLKSKTKTQRVLKPCINCKLDPDGNSTGVYREGGPSPFEGGDCPECEGLGKI